MTKAKPAKKQTSKKTFERKYIGWAFAALLCTSYAVALFAAINIKLVPTKYLVLLTIISLCIIVVLSVTNIRYKWRSAGKSIALILTSMVVLFANGYVYTASKSTSDFLADIESGEYYLESYSIATKTPYSVALQNSQNIGYIADDQNNEIVLDTVTDKTDASQTPYNELASLTVGLDDRVVDSIVLRSGLLQLLEQNYPSFYQSLTILDTFETKVKSDVNNKETDITKPYAIFIGGIDTYGEIESVSRSDVNIVAVINPKSKKVLLINTPRDYYVLLRGTTGVRDKLTHAGIYGIDKSRQTLEDLYQTPIDYGVRINFTSLLNIIDTIGGVSVYSDNQFSSGGYTFQIGYNQLNSKQALEFSRNRKSFKDGDRTRGKNQQRVIEAIIAKLNDPRSLLKYQTIIGSLGDSFQTNASKEEIAALLKQQMNNLGSWQVESVSAEGSDSSGITYSGGSRKLYVMEPNQDSLDNIRSKIQVIIQQY